MKAADYLPNIFTKSSVILNVHFPILFFTTIFAKLKIYTELELNKVNTLKKNMRISTELKSRVG